MCFASLFFFFQSVLFSFNTLPAPLCHHQKEIDSACSTSRTGPSSANHSGQEALLDQALNELDIKVFLFANVNDDEEEAIKAEELFYLYLA